MRLTGPNRQPDPAWDAIGTDPVALAEVLLPVLPRLKHLPHWPDDAFKGEGPPTVSQYRAIAYLAEREAVSMGELATAMQLSAAATSELVDRLIEREGVTRGPDPRDRRKVLIAITPKARAAWARVREERLRRLTAVISRLAPEDRQGFVRGVLLLADEIAGGVSGPPQSGTIPDCS